MSAKKAAKRAGWTFQEECQGNGVNRDGMKKASWIFAFVMSVSALLPALAQEPLPQPRPKWQAAPATTITVDGSEAMFTVMCALLASGFEADVNATNWSPMRAQLRDRLQHQEGPAVEVLRNFYKQHELADPGAMLSRYIWFGLISGPAPKFEATLRRDELPPEVIALEGFQEILSNYYKEQKIGELWRQVQSVHAREIEQMHESLSQVVFVATGYLREMQDPTNPRTFTVIVEPLVGRITNVRNFADHYALVVSGAEQMQVDTVRHAFLHFLLDPLPLQYSHVVAVKRPLFEMAAAAPRLDSSLKDDFPSYFAECTVRAVELKLKRMSPSEREAALEVDDADGYVLVRPLFAALAKFEGSEPAMKFYFPDLVRSVDVGAEQKRLSGIRFAGGRPNPDAAQSESLARRKPAAPATVPNDADAIAALTEGERRISEKNPQAAAASFQKVLVKYPDQPRAWYGLGVVAMMEQDGPRAKEVFGRLTSGAHAATQDPMVMAWSHVHLGNLYDIEGQPDRAKAEFEAALAVEGAPQPAKDAAAKALGTLSSQKKAERP
jgi:tetratricopeptide (TPR) repeat protein